MIPATTRMILIKLFKGNKRNLTLFVLHLITFIALPSVSFSTEIKDDPIKIAAIFSLTGKAKPSNSDAIKGSQLAARTINDNGGVHGVPVELLLLDNKSTPIGSHLAAKEAVVSNALAIIGSVWSSHSLAIAKVAQREKIPMISPVSTIPSLTRIGDFIFRGCYTDTFQGATLAKFARKDLNTTKALIFTDISSDFSISMSSIFADKYTALGGEIVSVIEYKAGQSKYEEEVHSASSHDTEVIFLSGHDESGTIAKLLQKQKNKNIILGSDGWGNESFLKNGGSEIDLGFYIDHWSPNLNSPLSNQFLATYQKDHTITPSTVLSYDAMMLIANAMQRATSLNRRDIRNAMQNTENMLGITGSISFDEHGDAQKTACILKISNGHRTLVKCVTPDHLN